MKRFITKLRPQTLAVFLVGGMMLAGSATAAKSMISGSDIKPGTVSTKQIKDRTITARDLSRKTIRDLKRPGPRGLRGPVGAQGKDGNQGPAGAAGSQGQKGDTGEAGSKGDTGEQGEAGARGATGATGATGAAGTAGLQGDRGVTGATGATGEAGLPGEKGDQGDAGPRGEQGETGEQGAAGEQGEVGPAGERGEDGADGADGQPGEPGADGTSFYDPVPGGGSGKPLGGVSSVAWARDLLLIDSGERPTGEAGSFPDYLPTIHDGRFWRQVTLNPGTYMVSSTATAFAPDPIDPGEEAAAISRLFLDGTPLTVVGRTDLPGGSDATAGFNFVAAADAGAVVAGEALPRITSFSTVFTIEDEAQTLDQRVVWFGQPVHYADNFVITKLNPYDQ